MEPKKSQFLSGIAETIEGTSGKDVGLNIHINFCSSLSPTKITGKDICCLHKPRKTKMVREENSNNILEVGKHMHKW